MSGFKAKLRRAVNEEGFKWTRTLEAISEEIELLACDIRALRSSDSSPAAPPPDGNRPEKLDSSPAAPQLAAPPAGWLTDRERHVLSSLLCERPRDPMLGWRDYDGVVRAILARAGSPPEQTAALWLTEKERAVVEEIASMIEKWFHMAWSDTDEKRCAVLRSILTRAGSPPVVVLPTVFQLSSLGDKLVALQQVKDAMDAAGVAWK